MPEKIYIISGLGADERMFQKLDFSGFDPVFIKWIKPIKKENIAAYAERLLTQIIEEQPVIIGLSFGGMMAVEISKLIETKKIILISAAVSASELPVLYRIVSTLGLQKLIPGQFYKITNFFINWLFGAETKEDKILLKEVLGDTDLDFAKWAIDSLLNWNNMHVPVNLHRIHGLNDHLLPIHLDLPHVMVKNGSHLMVLNKAHLISQHLKNFLIQK